MVIILIDLYTLINTIIFIKVKINKFFSLDLQFLIVGTEVGFVDDSNFESLVFVNHFAVESDGSVDPITVNDPCILLSVLWPSSNTSNPTN